MGPRAGAENLAPTTVFSPPLSVLHLCYFFVLTVPFVLSVQHRKHKHPCPQAGLEPATPASDWPQTLALDRSATGIGTIRSPDFEAHSESLYRLS